jgi:hypothetical protein
LKILKSPDNPEQAVWEATKKTPYSSAPTGNGMPSTPGFSWCTGKRPSGKFGGGEKKKNLEKASGKDIALFSQETVQKHWKEILENIPTQTVKVAARGAELSVPKEEVLELSTPTDFYFDTLMSAQGRNELAQALESFFHQKIHVQCKKGEKIQLTTNAQESAQKQQNQGPSIADIAGEIFGN